jgi:hypothetical protein
VHKKKYVYFFLNQKQRTQKKVHRPPQKNMYCENTKCWEFFPVQSLTKAPTVHDIERFRRHYESTHPSGTFTTLSILSYLPHLHYGLHHSSRFPLQTPIKDAITKGETITVQTKADEDSEIYIFIGGYRIRTNCLSKKFFHDVVTPDMIVKLTEYQVEGKLKCCVPLRYCSKCTLFSSFLFKT